MTDSFWDVRQHEEREERLFRQAIDEHQRRLAIVKRAEALRSATGFDDFVKAVESLRDQARVVMDTDEKLTDAGLREQRGKVRALTAILGLLKGQDMAQHLAREIKGLQNRLDEALKRRPIPREETP